jgi:hypothetical protein
MVVGEVEDNADVLPEGVVVVVVVVVVVIVVVVVVVPLVGLVWRVGREGIMCALTKSSSA